MRGQNSPKLIQKTERHNTRDQFIGNQFRSTHKGTQEHREHTTHISHISPA